VAKKLAIIDWWQGSNQLAVTQKIAVLGLTRDAVIIIMYQLQKHHQQLV